MTWCNLFSTESKFKITLNTSKTQAWLSFIGEMFLSLNVMYFSYFSLHQLVDVPHQPFIIVLFFHTLYLYHINLFKFVSTFVDVFEIDYDGYCLFSVGEKYFITNKSRISWYSCQLFLLSENKKSKHLYIFKDACSTSDYARICRIIKKQLIADN